MSNYGSDFWTADGTELMDWELEAMFKEWINESYEPVEVMGLTYEPADVLESCDPTAFRSYLNDWVDMEVREGNLFDHDPADDDDDGDD